MKKLLVLGIDHGNGNVKGRTEGEELLLPSAYARPEDFAKSITGKSNLDIKNFVSSKYENETYVWGKDVVEASKLMYTYGAENRYAQKEYKLLSEFTLASLMPKESASFDNVMVVTGCPSREKGTKLEEDLVNVFKGGHVIEVNEESKMINVKQVLVLPQPLGTVLSMYLDAEGFVADDSYEEDYIGVIDVGTGTTDLDGIKALSRLESDSDTIGTGMQDAYLVISDYVNKQNAAALATPQKVEQQILAGNDYYEISKRSKVDIKDIKDKAFRELAEFLKNNINQRWKNRAKFDKLLLTGGGAVPLQSYFQEWEEDIIVVEDSQRANANGFYRYGKFKARD